ncbi:hypothetical protein [Streptomyces sp. NPDC090025]|uniref:hypothetical protein n=1 Tax=Streptomyces sp. NPDC090025 TaxID=3365922 RepID=UPI0038396C79
MSGSVPPPPVPAYGSNAGDGTGARGAGSGAPAGAGAGAESYGYGAGFGSGQLPDFRPTHVVPRDGLPTWESPDPARPAQPLDAFLPVRLTDRVGDWGQVLCSNGWTAWVDARLLVSVPDDPPAAHGATAGTADPRPLIARAEEALARYRVAAEDLATGRTDGAGFRRLTRGLRVGMVVDGESVWLYDVDQARWVFCDGTTLSTYAASAAPSAAPAGPAAPGGYPSGGRSGGAPGDPVSWPQVAAFAGTPDGPAPTPTQVAPHSFRGRGPDADGFRER